MKKIIIPVALLGLYFLSKKNKEVQTPLVPVDANAVLTSVMSTLNDNDIVLGNSDAVLIKEQINKLNETDRSIVAKYFNSLNAGEEITPDLQKKFDTVAPNISAIILKFMNVAKTQKVAYRLHDDRGGDLSDVWSVANTISNFIEGGRIVFGVAMFIGNLFCGKKCQLRRAERAGN